MKNITKILSIAFFTFFTLTAYSQKDSLGLPGDNLDLTAVLAIFKEAKTPEEFEKKLNAADSKINNLDLNDDGQVDYLRVIDNQKDNAHTIVIRDPISKSEAQDVAVIEVEQKGDKTAHVQIIGDETLYGKNYIVEPKNGTKEKKSASGKIRNYDDDVYTSPNDNASGSSIINVWAWPSVSYIYAPGYVVWVSPWYWGYFPPWYDPWAPYGWYPYRANILNYNYYEYGRRSNVYYNPTAHKMYYGQRVSSGYVEKTVPDYNKRVQQQPHDGNIINEPRINKSEQNKNPSQRNQNQQPENRQQQKVNNTQPAQSNPRVQPQNNQGGQQRQSNPGTNRGGGGGGQSGGGSGRRK